MAYEESLIRARIDRRSRREAESALGELPETRRETEERRNPQMFDISGLPIVGLAYVETLTT